MNSPFIPATRRFRFQLGEVGYDPNRNWTLRRILYLIRYMAHLLKRVGGDCFIFVPTYIPSPVTGFHNNLIIFGESKPLPITGYRKTFLRAPEPMATRTLVANIGTDAPVTIYEAGKIVAIIAPGETRKLPLEGRLTLEARCQAGEETFLLITTQRRTPYPGEPNQQPPYGKAIQPIGGDIL